MELARREWLLLAGTASGAGLAGCLGGSLAAKPPLEIDRPATTDTECHEVDLVDRSYRLSPRLVPIGDSGQTWPVELEAGETLRISIFWWGEQNRVLSLPELRILDPAGEPLIEESRNSANHHEVTTSQTGTHTIEIANRYMSEGGRWKVEITWYPHEDCL